MKRYLIFGASKGLGDAFAKGLPEAGDMVWIVSRSCPNSLEMRDGVERRWIEADLSLPSSPQTISSALAGSAIDVFLYNAGIWESSGFSAGYDFEQDDPEEIARIMQVNVTSSITCLQKLLPNLKMSANPKIVLVGSTAGLDHTNNPQVSYVASKFGLRGVGHSIREHVRQFGIGVTCIHPGELAAEIPYEAGPDKAIETYGGTRIPVQDIVALVKCVTTLSRASCVKEISVPAMADRNA